MKKIRIILISLMILLCIKCGKDATVREEKVGKTGTEGESVENYIEKKIILTINNKNITNKDLKNFIKSHYPETSDIENNAKLTSRVFDTFIEQQVILYIVNQENIQVDQTEVSNYLNSKHLPADEVNEPSVINGVKAQKYLYFKIYKHIKVTDEEIRRHYNANLATFRKALEVLLHQILVKDKDKAYEIRKRLTNTPQKFKEIAKKESISREASNGGEMGYFEKGVLPKDMEDVVFSLKINTISPVVESPYGYHIFKVTHKKKERLLYLKKVEAEIRNKILSDKLRRAYEDLVSRLKKQLNIEVKYNQLYFSYQSIKGDTNDETKQNINPGNPNSR